MRSEIHLTRFGQYLAIEPATDEVIEVISPFYSVQHELPDCINAGDDVFPEYAPLIEPAVDFAGDVVLKCPIGLQPLVEDLFAQQGYRVRHVDARDAKLNRNFKKKDVSTLTQKFGRIDQAVLELIRTVARGIIHYQPGQVEPARLIAQVAMMWPRLRIVVLVSKIAEANKLKRQLQQYVPSVECYHHRHSSDKRVQIAIATYLYAGRGAVGLTRRHIVFVPEPAKFLRSKSGRECIDNAWIARMYAFQPTNKPLAQFDRDQITAFFGAQSVTIPAHGYVSRPVDVAFAKIDGQGWPRPTGNENLVHIKQYGVWKHNIRNRRLAQIAKASASGDINLLKERLPEVNWDSRSLSRSRNVVLVDGIDHAVSVLRKLPGWSLVCAPDVWLEGISDEDQQLIKQRRKGWSKNRTVIATPSTLPRLRKIDVLVRVDAGIGLPPLSDHVQRSRTADERLLVIDGNDRHHPQLRQGTRQRKQEYREAGWVIAGEEPESPLQQFLASRPELEVA